MLRRLREYREKRAYTQDELARLSRLSVATVHALENGREARLRTQRALARALKVEPEELL